MSKPRVKVNNSNVMSALVNLCVNNRPWSPEAVRDELGGGSLRLIRERLDKLIIRSDDEPFRGELTPWLVGKVASGLESKGIPVTAEAIRNELGSGSLRTIRSKLRMFRNSQDQLL